MPRNTKLSAYVENWGKAPRNASPSAPCGILSSSTRIVMRMAMTPSLKASSRPLLMTAPLLLGPRLRRHQLVQAIVDDELSIVFGHVSGGVEPEAHRRHQLRVPRRLH